MMDYPKWVRLELEDWPDFANRCKSILFERGDIQQGEYSYVNLLVEIRWKRQGQQGSVFEVVRRPMFDHPELDGLEEPRIVYAEVDCVCQCNHWEAGLVYQHILDTTERSSDTQRKRGRKGPRRG